MEQDFYTTITRPSTAEFRDRGSRFIAYAFPINDTGAFKQYLDQVKKEHPKASHHCFAYRIGHNKLVFRSSDAGEPSGTAGKPILGQIDSKGLTNVLVIVVRYFGGSLLGVPGLINAYKTAAALALQVTPVVQQPIEETYTLNFAYPHLNEVMILVRQMELTIEQKSISMFCTMQVRIPKAKVQEALYRFSAHDFIEVRKD